jgi:hypothetical protein
MSLLATVSAGAGAGSVPELDAADGTACAAVGELE